MKSFLFGILFAFAALTIAGFTYISSGQMPVATKGPPLPLEKLIAKTALHAAFKSEADKPSPIRPDEPNLLVGAKIYRTQCAVCHGLPSQPESAIAEGLFPKPPQLFKHGVDDDPVGETFWKVKNGIRLTGMPGFDGRLTETEMWQVTMLLSKGPEITDSVRKILSQPLQIN